MFSFGPLFMYSADRPDQAYIELYCIGVTPYLQPIQQYVKRVRVNSLRPLVHSGSTPAYRDEGVSFVLEMI